jgi:2-dehydropantoate 2-reductase
MKILVMGAGPLGSLFASRLLAAGHQVALLARGQRLADLREYGLVVEDAQTGERTYSEVQAVEYLDAEDAYDLVLVIMRKNLAAGVLPALKDNHYTPNILFMMNNAAGPDQFVSALGKARVLIGFPASAGARHGHIMRVLAGNENQVVSIPFGEVDGCVTERTIMVADILSSMPGYRGQIRTDMDAWLKTHVAILIPSIAAALYACNIDLKRMARTRDALVLAVRSVRENFRVLQALGIPITPAGFRRFMFIPEPFLVAFLRKILVMEAMETALAAHAGAARDEMQHLTDEFRILVRQSGVATPAGNRLYASLSKDTPLMPDGSASIPLDFRSTALGLFGLSLIFAVLFWLIKRPKH